MRSPAATTATPDARPEPDPPRVLVAGVGNIFLGDDGFGVQVARRLSEMDPLPGVVVGDYGIRGMHLAYDMLDRPADATILIDAVSRGGAPGTLYLIEPDEAGAGGQTVNAHAMQPDAVLALLCQLGGDPGRVLVLGCESARIDEGIGLSPPVAAAVDEAARRVRELAAQIVSDEVGEGSDRHVPGHTG